MLLNDFYKIIHADTSSTSVQALIELNKDHEIFQGHFPGQPVVPGVCMVQIIKEFTQDALGKKMRLTESDNIKFLSVIDPNQHPRTNVSLTIISSGHLAAVNASLSFGEVTFFKIKATFQSE
jgi:3-hydroxyacyl-[acyl-carrier-protein] dehydratase